VTVSQGREGKFVAVGAQQGKIRVGIIADHPRLDGAPVGAGELRIPCALHDMAVGEQEAVGRNDDAGAHSRRSVQILWFDPHHRGTDPVHDSGHCMRVGIEQDVVIARIGGLLRWR
jgi:hypothetical protein